MNQTHITCIEEKQEDNSIYPSSLSQDFNQLSTMELTTLTRMKL
jgi:hypothetical protein